MPIEIPKRPYPQQKTRVLEAPPPVVKGQVGRAVISSFAKAGEQLVQVIDKLDQRLKKAEATTQAKQAYRQSVLGFDQFIRDLEKDNEWGTFEQRFAARAEEIYAQQTEGITINEGQREFHELFENEKLKRLIQVKDKRRQKQIAYLQAELQLDIELGIKKAAETGDENYLKYTIESALEDAVITQSEAKKIMDQANSLIDFTKMDKYVRGFAKKFGLSEIDARKLGIEYLATEKAEEAFGVNDKQRDKLRDVLKEELGDLETRKKDTDEEERSRANSWAVDHMQTMTTFDVKKLFPLVRDADLREKWLNYVDKRNEDVKKEKEEKYKGSDITEGTLLLKIWSQETPRLIMSKRIEDAFFKGLEKDSDGIDDTQARALRRDLDNYLPAKDKPAKALIPGHKEALEVLKKAKNPVIKARAMLALAQRIQADLEKGVTPPPETLIDYAEKVLGDENEKKLKEFVDEIPYQPITSQPAVIEAEKREFKIIGEAKKEEREKAAKINRRFAEKWTPEKIEVAKREWSSWSGIPLENITEDNMLQAGEYLAFKNNQGDLFMKYRDAWVWIPRGSKKGWRLYKGELRK